MNYLKQIIHSNQIKDFINWLFNFIFDSLHLDSTFGKRNQNLLILTIFIEIVGVKFPNDDQEDIIFDYINSISRKNIVTLIECLWDTYVGNKNLALQLLFKIDILTFQKYVT